MKDKSKIFLSSYGLCSPIISEKAKEYINPEEKTVLVIPFAGFNNDNTAMREIDKGLVPFGFKKKNIFVADSESTERSKEIHPDIIYVPGGNPFKLLCEAKSSGLLSLINNAVKNGSLYWGISAGADLCCEDLSYLRLVEDCDYCPQDYNGLGIIKNKKILCHVDQRPMGLLQQVRDFDEKGTLYLRNDELYVTEIAI